MYIYVKEINFNSLLNLFVHIIFSKEKINLILFFLKKNLSFNILKFFLFFSKIKVNNITYEDIYNKNSQLNNILFGAEISKDLYYFRNKFISSEVNLVNFLKENHNNKVNLDFFLKYIFIDDYNIENSLADRLMIFKILQHYSISNSCKIIFLKKPMPWDKIFMETFNSENIKFSELKNFIPDFNNFYLNIRKMLVFSIKFLFFKLGFRNKKYLHSDNQHIPKIGYESLGEFNLKKNYFNSDLFFFQYSPLVEKNIAIEYQNHEEEEIILESSMHPYIKRKNFNNAQYNYKLPSSVKNLSNLELRELKLVTIQYNNQYSFWEDLFMNNGIKIFLMWNKFNQNHIVIGDVLKNIGGILTMWERSFQSIPSVNLITKCDIMFRCGSWDVDLDIAKRNIIKYNVKVGFLRDYNSSYTKVKALEIRNSLLAAGAKKIIAVFDQNSQDALERENYFFILNLLFENPELGIVFKPKKSKTLMDRLQSDLQNLIEKAQKTGRCYIFKSSGKYQSNIPIIMAAQCADLCIHCKLGTAGIESALSGTPTIFINRERGSLGINELETNKVVFDNWPDAIIAIKEYLNSRKKIEGFGDWGSILDELDPYRDGMGAYRMGQYLHNLINGFEKGLKRNDILTRANEIFINEWGKDKVIF